MSKLHVDSVIKSFNTKQVLTDIFIACNKGEIIGLLGRNGTGKSTLLKIIFGSLAADRKFVKVGDQIVNKLYDSRKLIKFLPQDDFLPNQLSINNIINIFCDKQKAKIIKEHNFIKPLLRRKSKQLAGGEKRLLEILLILNADSKFTLVDEPFNGLAPIHIDEVKKLIKEQAKYKGLIITDHDYRNIIDLASRVLILHDGGLKEVKSQQELIEWGYISPKNNTTT